MVMLVRVDREQRPIKAGWASSAPAFRVEAHGGSREVADLNLERTVRQLLAPFRRAGTLRQELSALGLETEGDDDGLDVVLQEAQRPR